MIIYFGAAALFLFFTGLAFISAKFLHLEGATWYFFVCLLGVLGLSAAAFWVYFQTKWQRKEGSDEGSAPGGGTDAVNADHRIRDANAKLARNVARLGVQAANRAANPDPPDDLKVPEGLDPAAIG